MKVCVVGCGAVGSIFAAHLARGGEAEVYAYDVAKDHVDAIRKNGLRLSGAADFTVPLQAPTDAHELPPCDFGIVATKSTHTRSAIEKTAHLFSGGAPCAPYRMASAMRRFWRNTFPRDPWNYLSGRAHHRTRTRRIRH